MNSTTVKVSPGICGMDSYVTVGDENGQALISAVSPCAKVMKMVGKLAGADMFALAMARLPQNPAVLAAGENALHAACPVPVAIIKAAEVSCGLALRKDISISFVEAGEG